MQQATHFLYGDHIIGYKSETFLPLQGVYKLMHFSHSFSICILYSLCWSNEKVVDDDYLPIVLTRKAIFSFSTINHFNLVNLYILLLRMEIDPLITRLSSEYHGHTATGQFVVSRMFQFTFIT